MNELRVSETENSIKVAARGYTVDSDKDAQLNWYLGEFYKPTFKSRIASSSVIRYGRLPIFGFIFKKKFYSGIFF